jgi:hypothetical protein
LPSGFYFYNTEHTFVIKSREISLKKKQKNIVFLVCLLFSGIFGIIVGVKFSDFSETFGDFWDVKVKVYVIIGLDWDFLRFDCSSSAQILCFFVCVQSILCYKYTKIDNLG